MKSFLLMLCLLAAPALAGDAKECKAECKEFVAECQKGCDTQLKKKNPRANEGCKKNCTDFVKECEKGCDSGDF